MDAPHVFMNEEAFLAEEMPGILNGLMELKGARDVSVLFTTYRCVHGLSRGTVSIQKPGLHIGIHQGELDIPVVMDGWYLMTRGWSLEESNSKGASAQEASEEGAFDSISRQPADLIFTYIGVTAFKKCIAAMPLFRKRCPNATIVVVTCDHNADEATLAELCVLPVDHIVVVGRCGAERELRVMLNQIVDLWPS